MGIEAQNTLYALAKLGVIDRHKYTDSIRYDINCSEHYFRPEMDDLKNLEDLCKPSKMWIDADDHVIYMEYTL